MVVLAFLLFVVLQDPAVPQFQGTAMLQRRVTDQVSSLPIAGAIVTVTTDRARANRERPIEIRTANGGAALARGQLQFLRLPAGQRLVVTTRKTARIGRESDRLEIELTNRGAQCRDA